jgi:16S rRNA (cytosine1402-N4)-methyltransferase
MASHEPVMTVEVLSFLAPQRGGVFVDCTVGLGGHSRALLEAGASRVIGIDRDAEALGVARDTLAPWGDRCELLQADYRDLPSLLDACGADVVDGVLVDLGVSSFQLAAAGRGFSFLRDERLDMRMDRSQGPTAADLLRDAPEEELANAIFLYGEERRSRRIARLIVRAREEDPVATTGRLAAIVRRAVPAERGRRIDPATRTFQALRIWVNRELDGLDRFLGDGTRRLRAGARMVVITFHSLEDRAVKHTFRALRESGGIEVLTKKPLRPSEAEVARNPRARSAKLRAVERVAA